MIQSPQRQPVSLRISITERCQHRCLYCMPPGGVRKRTRRDILRFEEIVNFVGVMKSHFALSKVHITGGEPLIRKGVVDLIGMLGCEGVGDLALTTNGQLLADSAAALKQAGLNRVNVSLDSLSPDTFRDLTRGGELRNTLRGIDAALSAGLAPLKLNVAVLRGINSDEILEIARFGLRRGCHVRFLELMPIGPAARRFKEWFVSSEEVHTRLTTQFDLRRKVLAPGMSSVDFLATDGGGAEGVIGLISSYTRPFCRTCHRLRLTATGQLIGCLALGKGPVIRGLLRGDGTRREPRLVEAIRRALGMKRTAPEFPTTKSMVKVGG